MPKRIQMSRQHPWRAENPGAVIVARPSRFGNLHIVMKDGSGMWGVKHPGHANIDDATLRMTRTEAAQIAVDFYRFDAQRMADVIQAELRGKDVACWCALSDPCHADVLLEIANRAGA